jgi:hypothetical protein
VEIKGALDAQMTKLQIDSIKMLEKGSAMCAAKAKKEDLANPECFKNPAG